MKRRERLVKMPPADGSICGAEVLEVEKCMMPECRKSQPWWWSGTVPAPPTHQIWREVPSEANALGSDQHRDRC